ncbi:MAG: hypothetical protein IT303_12320 [Dehalococcoidia bacterium]|nr:hypothetical protein [Dehalococcoidia bacterium]
MLTENGHQVDDAAVEQVLLNGDVITVGFTLLPQRLLVDTRVRPGEGPLVAIVAPVATVQERYLWLGKHRGSFGSPQSFSFFAWPHTIRNLVERDALAPLRARLADISSDGAATLDAAVAKLAMAEREAMKAAVTGSEAWQTLWERAVA